MLGPSDSPAADPSIRTGHPRRATMLSEKFILVIEAIRRQQGDGRVVSTSPHVPVTLPEKKPN
jgi:hypothetical protein